MKDEKRDERLVLRLLSKSLSSNGKDLGSSSFLEEEELDSEKYAVGDHLRREEKERKRPMISGGSRRARKTRFR